MQTKFRGKSLSTGEWVYGSLIKYQIFNREVAYIVPYTQDVVSTCGNTITIVATQVDPTTVGQYTGLEDKNGKEIYEGDFLTLSSYRGREEVKVEWHNAGYYIFIHKDGTKTGQYFRLPDSKMIELVSHDNPDLLTQ